MIILLAREVIYIYRDRISRSDMTVLTLVSAAMTIPFLYLAKDIAKSLRIIANKKSGAPEYGKNP